MEGMHNEIKRLEQANRIHEEKVRLVQAELTVSNAKTNKYKKIAKQFKTNLE